MKWCRRILKLAGWLWIIQMILALAGPPRAVKRWLNGADEKLVEPPRYVVVLSGGGIPSESSLIRAYYAAECARTFTGATVVVAMPTDGDPEQSSVGRMREELVMRGVPRERIVVETRGLNTRQQAANVAALLGEKALEAPVVVVTSEFHLRRALLCFRKAGFSNVGGVNATNVEVEADTGRWQALRYGVWGNLVASIKMSRELAGIAVGKMTGSL